MPQGNIKIYSTTKNETPCIPANAESLMSTLQSKGCAARVVKTNETISGHTGWFRVIASSYDDKASAARSRDELKSTYAGAWLLYNK